MNEQLVKSLTSLIDETIAEIEDLKKSRFSAAEVQLSGPGDGIASLQPSGELEAGKPAMQKEEDEEEAKKAEKKDEEKEDKDEDKEEEAKKAEEDEEEDEEDEEEEEAKKGEDCEEAKKAEWEGVIKEAEKKKSIKKPALPMKKAEEDEDEEEDKDEDKKDMEKYEGINREEAASQKMPEKSKSESTDEGVNRSVAAPKDSKPSKKSESYSGINRSASPRDSKSEKTPSPKSQPAEGYEVKKSSEETDSLTKSYVDEKLGGLEKKISSLFDMIKKIGDQPMPPKGVPAGVAPLKKSETESLSKAELASKLFELKKSGTRVDSADIASIELGQDFSAIVNKYNLR